MTGPRHLGAVTSASGPVVRATGLSGVTVGEVVRVGPRRLLAEVIQVDRARATLQVYEDTSGTRVGDDVEATGAPLVAWLGPGLLGSVFDGLQRPLERLAATGAWLLTPGRVEAAGAGPAPALGDRRWPFEPGRVAGDEVGPGDVLGEVAEGPLRHRVLVPPDVGVGRLRELASGEFGVADVIGRLEVADGIVPLRLAHAWPVRVPRPAAARQRVDRPLVTGQRVIDMLFPVARGGAAVIPGGFGTGKTVVEQQLARSSDADVVVYVGCGERGNEMAELLTTFPRLIDPRTGGPLLDRTVLIANTSNMPVAAREASVQLGMTIAEYLRDQGLHVAILADSTSRWAEALREISGRLEELPGEEGFPAYLASRLAGFYERTGHVAAVGTPERVGSITLVAAVSPPGGDFSEPVTQASLRLAGAFWGLDVALAHARHFPAIGWTQSYSLYVDGLAPWFAENVSPSWAERRAEAIEILSRERALLDIVALVGADALPESDRALLEVARFLRETFLQQHALDPTDSARPLDVQFALLAAVLAVRSGLDRALDRGSTLEAALAAPELSELRRVKEWTGDDLVDRLADLTGRVARLEPHAAAEPEAAAQPGVAAAPEAAARSPAAAQPGAAPQPGAAAQPGATAQPGPIVAGPGDRESEGVDSGVRGGRTVSQRDRLSVRRVRGSERLAGPLLFLRGTPGLGLGEEVLVTGPDGGLRHGQIVEIDAELAVVQVYEGTRGLDVPTTTVELEGEPFRLGVSAAMLGRVMDGRGAPIDHGPPIIAVRRVDVNGGALNPAAREHPHEFIETGVSAIDLLASLVCGQKLPIFTGAGLPADALAARIATGARLLGDERFVTIFAAMGISRREADYYRDAFAESGSLDRIASFLNLADDPAIERLLTPRCALTLGEHLAHDLGMNVLVVLTDVLGYGEALRELSTARNEIPGRRGYPGYLYTDLATLFERAGRVKGRPGSLTILPIVTLPDDDITHPIPDLTGYITEGQIVLSRELWGRGVWPPIDVLPCLSRVMNAGIGQGRTRSEHRVVADQLYASYARGRELRRLVTVIGEAALTPPERRLLAFADRFESLVVSQGAAHRTLDETFEVAWHVLGLLPRDELTRIPEEVIDAAWRPVAGLVEEQGPSAIDVSADLLASVPVAANPYGDAEADPP
jgi:V/A-type H+-transporting ATPase subunit A